MRQVAFLTLISLVSEVRYRTLNNYVNVITELPSEVLNYPSEGASNHLWQNERTRGFVGGHLGPGAISNRSRYLDMKWTPEDIKHIATFNCQGLATSEVKRRLLVNDFENKNISILAVQETNLKGQGVLDLLSFSQKKYKLYYSGHKTMSRYGVGFVVEDNRTVTFDPISERICKLVTKINENDTLEIICAYAPTLEQSETKPEVREAFYAELDSVIQKSRSRNSLVISGDFNAKTGSAC